MSAVKRVCVCCCSFVGKQTVVHTASLVLCHLLRSVPRTLLAKLNNDRLRQKLMDCVDTVLPVMRLSVYLP